MKKSIKIVGILLTSAIFLSFTNSFANQIDLTSYSVIESNLLVGLESGNDGLASSCTYFLGELKSENAIIPLMRILHKSENSALRQGAALALYKINSERGMFAVKRAFKFDNDKQTRKICKIIFYQHKLREMKGEVRVEPLFVVDLDSQFGDYKLSDFNN